MQQCVETPPEVQAIFSPKLFFATGNKSHRYLQNMGVAVRFFSITLFWKLPFKNFKSFTILFLLFINNKQTNDLRIRLKLNEKKTAEQWSIKIYYFGNCSLRPVCSEESIKILGNVRDMEAPKHHSGLI